MKGAPAVMCGAANAGHSKGRKAQEAYMNYLLYPFAALGALSIVLFVVGFWLDFSEFDQTRGGYEPPYEGVTGEPIDWYAADRTPVGLARRGRVVNTLVNATTALISFEIYGVEIPFRPLSPRALAVHNPRAAFVAMGVDPQF